MAAAPDGNELNADTFWGFAQDGLEVTVFNARGAQVQARAGSAHHAERAVPHLELRLHAVEPGRRRCTSLPGSANDGPIVAWGMNPSSGTYATFNTYLINNGGAPAGFAANGQACVEADQHRPTVYSIENDIKPIVNSPTVPALSTVGDVGRQPEQLDLVGLVRRVLGVPGHLEDGARRYDGDGDRGSGERRAAEHQRHHRQHLPDRSDAVPRHSEERRGLPEDRGRM